MINYTQKFYKGEEIVYSITSIPEITTDTFSIVSVNPTYQNSNISVRKINNHSFGVTCNATSDTYESIDLYISITNSAISKDIERKFQIQWEGKFQVADRLVSTYNKANLFQPVVLQNIGTYCIDTTVSTTNYATVIDPELDGILQGYRLSEFNDYDLETSTDKNDAAEHYEGKGIATYMPNPLYPTYSTNNGGWINDGGTLKLPWTTVRSNSGKAYGLNDYDNQSGIYIPSMIPDPQYAEVLYPEMGNDVFPNMPAQFIGWKTEIAPDVWLYIPQGTFASSGDISDSDIVDTVADNDYSDTYGKSSNSPFRDENGNIIPNTDSIGEYFKAGNFIIKSTKNITKIRIWAKGGVTNISEIHLAANKGNLSFIISQQTNCMSSALYVWTGRSKHIKFTCGEMLLHAWVNSSGQDLSKFGWMGDIHSYTSNNQTTNISTEGYIEKSPREYQNPKVYLIDQENPINHTNDQLYDGTIHNVWVSAMAVVDPVTGERVYKYPNKPLQYFDNDNDNYDNKIGVYLIQVETED